MSQIHPLLVIVILLGLSVGAGRAADSPFAAEPDPRLDQQTLAADQALVDRAIAELKDIDSAKREQAAATLRRLVAKYPSHTVYLGSDDGGRAVWKKKLSQIKLGMTKAEVLEIAPYFEGGALAGGSGNSFFESYQLDYHASMSIVYEGFTLEAGDTKTPKVAELPELAESVFEVQVSPPQNFTGLWTTWHVNGQKACDDEYVGGKAHGVSLAYHDNGRKSEEQHYVANVLQGALTGWDDQGRLTKTYFFLDNERHGTWTNWYPNGNKERETNFDHGKQEGRETTWYEDGRVRSIADYHQDVLHGLSARWDRNGKLEYEHHYDNGKRLP